MMIHINAKWRILAAASVAAASLAACHDDHHNGSASNPPPPPPAAVDFSTFAKNTFAANADTTPVSLDGVTFNFDVDNDPTAFDALVMSGSY